jgi:O-phosphoseryl-tRNA(Cys) synthetase
LWERSKWVFFISILIGLGEFFYLAKFIPDTINILSSRIDAIKNDQNYINSIKYKIRNLLRFRIHKTISESDDQELSALINTKYDINSRFNLNALKSAHPDYSDVVKKMQWKLLGHTLIANGIMTLLNIIIY